jgi:TetR/AcrR family transcriptional regulator
MEDSKIEIILEAAQKRFAHYGIGKTTMNEIAADIGMSKASLYYYFPDKERLFVAVVDKDIDRFVDAIEDIIQKPSKASFKLKKYISIRNSFFKKLMSLPKVELASLSEFTPVVNELRTNLFNKEKLRIEKIIQLGIREDEFVRVNAETYADLFLCALIGLRTSRLSAGFTLTEENYEKMANQSLLFVDLFLKSLRKQG